MARTLAQQIDCSLDSMSSFHLMAPRLYKNLDQTQIYNPFWIKDILPRRGIIAGKYELIKIHQEEDFYEFSEIIPPQLISNKKEINPSIKASDNIEKDIISLINFSEYCQKSNFHSNFYRMTMSNMNRIYIIQEFTKTILRKIFCVIDS